MSKEVPTNGDIAHIKAVLKEIAKEPYGMRRYGKTAFDEHSRAGSLEEQPIFPGYRHLAPDAAARLSKLNEADRMHDNCLKLVSDCVDNYRRGQREVTARQLEDVINKSRAACQSEYENVLEEATRDAQRWREEQVQSRVARDLATAERPPEYFPPPSYEEAVKKHPPDASRSHGLEVQGRTNYLSSPGQANLPVSTQAPGRTQQVEMER
ncbi:hypothetical protein [Stenotrophomonas maltophilia]|uniref:hypothetical protein n=1 Tax=Stenotrophomonas maltophilia TaxID=40324 RepID=UPI003D7EB2B6